MTERWRKKLRDLDTTGPTDDVFQRAKAGPMHLDEPVSGPRTSTRVVTAIVAFALFALALSVFLIPALRMDDAPVGGGSATFAPLWPTQYPDELLKLQDNADAGNAAWALDPQSVAEKFGHDVMGWSDVAAQKTFDPYCFNVSSPGPGTSPVACRDLQVGGWSVPGGNPPDFSSPSGAPNLSGSQAFALFPCQGCSLSSAPEWVQVYQPLGQGPGHIWAVLQAQGSITLSVEPGQIVHDGSTISGGFETYGGARPLLGYGSCNERSSISDPHDVSGDGSYVEMRIDVGFGVSCAGEQPGYAWGSISVPSGTDVPAVSGDPFAGGQGPLLSLTAVPVTMVFPVSAEQTASPTASVSPTPDATSDRWVSYTDPMGFSLEMPASWGKTSVTGELVLSAPGGEPYVQITRVPNEGFHDDSSFPLDYSAMASSAQPHFYGDGQGFIIQWLTGTAAAPTDADVAIFDRITGSISFEPWSVGAQRNGFTAIGKVHPASSAEWIDDWRGVAYLSSFVNGKRQAFGPSPGCLVGKGVYEIRETGVAGITCSDGTGGFWEFATGKAQPGNTVDYSADLRAFPAVRSWDGYLLVELSNAG